MSVDINTSPGRRNENWSRSNTTFSKEKDQNQQVQSFDA